MGQHAELSLKSILSAAINEAAREEDAEVKTASAEQPEGKEQDVETETQDQEIVKIASADALALADQLDALAEDGEIKTASAEPTASPKDRILAKLGAQAGTAVAPTHEPQAETNLSKVIAPTKPKQDKAKTVAPVTAPPAMETPNKLKTNEMETTPGEMPDNVAKTSAARRAKLATLRGSILKKLAGDDYNPASISASKATANPEDEAAPAQPQSADRALVSSNESAIRYTKGQAKATQKKVLSGILDEPAMSKATDSKLHNNLVNASKAGVKISEARDRARDYLRKVASRAGTPEHARLVEKLQQFREKRAAAGRSRESIRQAMRKKSFFPGSYGASEATPTA